MSPPSGLDPQTRARVWDHLRAIHARRGLTIFMTTLWRKPSWCDRIAIIDQGRIVALGTPNELKASVGGDVVVLATDDDARAIVEIREKFQMGAVEGEGDQLDNHLVAREVRSAATTASTSGAHHGLGSEWRGPHQSRPVVKRVDTACVGL